MPETVYLFGGQTIDRKTGSGGFAKKTGSWMHKPESDDHAAANITLPGFSVTATASNQTPAPLHERKALHLVFENIYPAVFDTAVVWVRVLRSTWSIHARGCRGTAAAPCYSEPAQTFALTVVGDSMDAPSGYREGEIVYIDPDIEPTPGKDVLAKADGKMTLKRYKGGRGRAVSFAA